VSRKHPEVDGEIIVKFKGHTICVERKHDHENWYITVTAPNGCYAYDGWWSNSEHTTALEAIEEAKSGALLAARKESK
jgi:hypothetical protein